MAVNSTIMKEGPRRRQAAAAGAPGAARKNRKRGESLGIGRNFLAEYEKILRENNGRLPERKDLKRQGHGDWLNEMYRRKIGLNQLRKIIGCKSSRRIGEDSLSSIGVLVPRLKEMMQNEGLQLLPDSHWKGWKDKYSPEMGAISRNGGLHKLREIAGPASLGAPAVDYYRDWNNAKAGLAAVIEKKYWLPPIGQVLCNPRNELLVQSVYAFHGNWWEARMRLEAEGLAPAAYVHCESKGRPLSDPEVILRIARKLAERNGGAVPGAKTLKRMGLFHLASPITVNGGCKKLTEIIRFESAAD
jgi:hypothetical protein